MQNMQQEQLIEKIRTQYTEKQPTDLDELRRLDARVKRPATVFAAIFGTLAALVMGSGMSLILTDLGQLLGIREALLPGVILGCVGLIMALLTHPLYRRILHTRKNKYAAQIIALSDRLMQH